MNHPSNFENQEHLPAPGAIAESPREMTKFELRRELQELHKLLEESRNRYVDLYDFAPVGYVILDSMGRIHEINHTASAMLETEQAKLVGQTLRRWLYGDDRVLFSRHLRSCATALKSARIVTELRILPQRSGQPQYVQLHSEPMSDLATGSILYRSALIDISRTKRLEEAEALSRALREERSMRETFFLALAHDLRTPITSIRMGAELQLRMRDDQKSCRELSRKLIDDADRIDNMIRDLLDASRTQAGKKLSLKIEQLELVAMVRHTLELLTVIHGDRFVIEACEPVEGYWDREAMRRAVENLANNALKYGCPRGMATIRVVAVGDLARISVHNVGNPIDQADLPFLFRQYARIRNSSTGGKKGWGLGLTLVQGTAQSHGGTVSVRSSEAEGTTFTIEVPRDVRPHYSEA